MNENTKTRIRAHSYGETEVVIYRLRTLDDVGTLAAGFIDKWGMVAAVDDGEDSSGRAKLRLATPDELVQRAYAIAERLMSIGEARGHVLPVPDLNEANAEHDARAKETKTQDLEEQLVRLQRRIEQART